MHLKRQAAATNLPIKRKGTTYIARAFLNPYNSVPLLIALRDMLKLVRTRKELKKMIKLGLLKINGRVARDYRDSINIFNILEADKKYLLTILKTGRFAFEEANSHDRLCKVIGKKLLSGGKIQLNLHDGTNLLSNDKINIEDSVYLSQENKIKKHLSLEKGAKIFVMSGKYRGFKGVVSGLDKTKAVVNLKDKEGPVELSAFQLIANE